ncbi:MAG: hypothetical protein DRJ60_02260 [Thermoprotei archaeon]|nr:MAG: hypothetical protein DRJ60_02260 [Thermoprotei archaeon]
MVALSLMLVILMANAFIPSYAGEIACLVLAHSKVHDALAPYERVIKLSATQAIKLDVADHRETLLAYYRLAYDSMLHNKLEKCAHYVGTLLALMLKVKGYSEQLGSQLLSLLERLDWGSVRLYSDDPEKLIDYWLSYKPKDLEDLAYAYASITLSLLERLPLDSFIRILYTPRLRELYTISLVLIVVTSAYFVVKRVKEEAGGVRYEGYR